jgi:tetratricopeptide (TPR) repeat protein
MGAVGGTRRNSPAGFFVLIALAVALAAFALYKGQAPVRTPFPEDWIIWARGTATWAGALAVGVVVLLIGVIGLVINLLSSARPARKAHHKPVPAEIELAAAPAVDLQTATRASESRNSENRNSENRGNLRFNAQNVATLGLSGDHLETVVAAPSLEVQSLEPAIFSDHGAFSDNASDSFMTRMPEAPAEAPIQPPGEVPAFDATAALSETHGLHIHTPTAEIVPIRPDIVLPAEAEHDPLAAALLAETPDVVTHAPQGDINAVISSAMRFAPQSEPQPEAMVYPVEAVAETIAAPAAEIVPDVVPAPMPEPVPVQLDDEAEIRQAARTALSVWPDSTRAIAADELSARISHLYYDKSPASQKAFQLIASGDLSAAAAALATQADALAEAGNHAAAAELWRVSGALHMGRDDSKAMAAYEHVSELDPNDANIHLYLARRYQMAGDTARQPAVIARALGVISDPAIRAELLAPYADLKLKAGDAKAAGDAFEELSRLHETEAYLRPDDVGVRSTLAITVARLAQAREMQGAFEEAGPLYRKAHKVFADLSALKPEHPGLRAMADNALRDAQRFNIA